MDMIPLDEVQRELTRSTSRCERRPLQIGPGGGFRGRFDHALRTTYWVGVLAKKNHAKMLKQWNMSHDGSPDDVDGAHVFVCVFFCLKHVWIRNTHNPCLTRCLLSRLPAVCLGQICATRSRLPHSQARHVTAGCPGWTSSLNLCR